MAELKIDELNINQPFKNRSEPYEQYFDVMAISKRQKRERILLAEELEDIFFEFLLLMELLHEYKKGYEQAQEQLEIQYRDKMFEILPEYDGDFIRDYAAAYAVNAVETTAKHIEKPVDVVSVSPKKTKNIGKKQAQKIQKEVKESVGDIVVPKIPVVASLEAENQPESSQADSWYISLDRAKFNAENEANTILNRSDFLKAKEAGYTRKRWLTEHDNRVRPTHAEIEGLTIPIDEYFVVGDSIMSYAHDVSHGASVNELANCRCATVYLR